MVFQKLPPQNGFVDNRSAAHGAPQFMMALLGFLVAVACLLIGAHQAQAQAVTSVSVPANDTYVQGENLDFTVNFDEAVVVTGTPQIALEIGSQTRQASYVSGSGSAALIFRYTVVAGETDSDGIRVEITVPVAISLNGGSILAQDDSAASTLTLIGVGSTTGVLVDSEDPTVSLTGPSGSVTASFDVTATFSESVTGLLASEVTVTNGSVTNLSGSGTTYTISITPTTVGQAVTVQIPAARAQDAASNDNVASNVLTLSTSTPSSEFAASEAEIRDVVLEAVQQNLQGGLASSIRLSQDARNRFISGQRSGTSGLVSRNNVAFDVDGVLSMNGATMATNGTFFGQNGNYEGTYRRLFFGDFNIHRNDETGSTTATISGKLAWEYEVSDTVMLGYFIGAELGQSDIDGVFSGDQEHYGLSVGGYGGMQLRDGLFVDGFATLGRGFNGLDISNGSLQLDGDYVTRSATVGFALTGVIERVGYEIWPELAVSYGRTLIGNIGLTGRASGLVDDSLTLDAGRVEVASISFQPQFKIPLDGLWSRTAIGCSQWHLGSYASRS